MNEQRLLHLPTLTDTDWKVCSERHFAPAFYFALQWMLNLAPYFLQEMLNQATGKTTANLSRLLLSRKVVLRDFDSLDSLTVESVFTESASYSTGSATELCF